MTATDSGIEDRIQWPLSLSPYLFLLFIFGSLIQICPLPDPIYSKPILEDVQTVLIGFYPFIKIAPGRPALWAGFFIIVTNHF